MKNFINIKDVSSKDLKKIILDAKKRKIKRVKLNALDLDKDSPLKGKLLIQMFENVSSNLEKGPDSSAKTSRFGAARLKIVNISFSNF